MDAWWILRKENCIFTIKASPSIVYTSEIQYGEECRMSELGIEKGIHRHSFLSIETFEESVSKWEEKT